MATKVIGDYSAAATIDGSTHFLLIQPGNSSTAYNKISRNVLLGVTGQPVDISSVQTLSNKVIGNTNLVTLLDGSFTLQNNVDTTKRAIFSLAGITTATTRTYTLPNATSTLADISTAQTFTNKTLTSPVISGGSIDNSTITVDAISGHTTPNSGTIYGVAITSAKISGASLTAGTVGSTALATNAVQGSQLATNAITLGVTQVTTSSGALALVTSDTNITALSVTVTVPSGGRRIKITAFGSDYDTSGAIGTQFASIKIKESTTVLATTNVVPGVANFPYGWICVANIIPTAGSHTYNVAVAGNVTGPAFTIGASATAPAFILVEMI